MSQPLPQHLPGLVSALAPVVQHYGYFAVGGLLFIENFGIPVPGETTLITAAFFAGFGQLNIVLVILVGFLASVLGDNIGFAIGNYGGRRLIERFGKYVFLNKERLDKAEGFFARNGSKVVLVARFIEGLRQLNGILAGASDMSWNRFIVFNAIGAALWVAVWSSVGYYGGSNIGKLHEYGVYLSVAAVIAIVGYVGYRLISRRRIAR